MSLHARALRTIGGLIALTVAGAVLVLIEVQAQHGFTETDSRNASLAADSDALQAALADQQISLTAYGQTRSEKFLSLYFNGRQRAAAVELRMQRATATELWAARPVARVLLAADQWQAWADGQAEGVQVSPPGEVALSPDGSNLYSAVRYEAGRFRDAVAAQRTAAMAGVSRGQVFLLAIIGACVLVAASGLFGLGRLLLLDTLRPIGRLNQVAGALAAGKHVAIPELDRDDEVGRLAQALAGWDRSVRGRLALAQAMVEVSGEINLHVVLESGAKQLAELMGATLVAFILQEEQGPGRAWLYVEGLGLRDPRPTDAALPAASIAREAMRDRRIISGDLSSGRWQGPLVTYAQGRGLGPIMALPMVSGGDLVGAVVMLRAAAQPGFSAHDFQSAEILVPSLAAAINVCRLFAALRGANAELVEASRHKSEFLATMSHELRTPLNSILGFSQLLQSTDFGRLNERQARYVGHINSSGEHLLALINDVLDISKVEAGQLALSPEALRLRPLLGDCVGRLQPQAAAKRVELRLVRCGQLAVWADGRRLHQIVLNLLSNAIKFTPEGGRVGISARLDRDVVRISVNDTGIGIPRQELGRIFERFTQVTSGRTRQQEGTGLGLALSRRLAELMGGSITVQSHEGRGSVFTVSLPASGAGAEPAPRPEHRAEEQVEVSA